MKLLIDGYNLLHASGVFAPFGAGDLHAARMALLERLADRLSDAERGETTIVFDAHDAPRGLPREYQFREITVRFAADHPEADDLIEELIQGCSLVRQLTVVSSDRRLQRAARRRRATAVDSQRWLRSLESSSRSETPLPAKPDAPNQPGDVRQWVEAFGPIDDLDILADDQTPVSDRADEADRDAKQQALSKEEEPWNPFPPGYGEDLEDRW